MAETNGFWSYVHKDDEAERERISQLARDVVAQYELLTGESIGLFLDKDAIGWGEDWRAKIDESLSSVAFFIPVLTPRYFLSAECRREAQYFARRATALGVKELVLPLLYVDVPALHEETPADDLVGLLNTFQREDWTDLRFTEPGSERYRRGAARLAEQLAKANAQAERADVAGAAAELESVSLPGEEVEEPGWLDRLARAETTIPEWTETLESMTEETNKIGQLMQEAAQDIRNADARGQGVAARLTIARRVAQEMAEPTERIYSLGNEFTSQLHAVDDGLRVVFERAPTEVRGDPLSMETVCEFFAVVRALSDSSHEALGRAEQLINAVSPMEAMSRDLRPPLRRLREGLTLLLEAREVTDEWVRLMDETGIECEESSGPIAETSRPAEASGSHAGGL